MRKAVVKPQFYLFIQICKVIFFSLRLDYESKQHHQLTVRATDAVGSGGYSETIVIIDVTDVNDCAPTFVNDSYTVRISESAAVGTRLLQVKATDADAGQEAATGQAGLNSQLTYSVLDSEFFSVEPDSGLATQTH